MLFYVLKQLVGTGRLENWYKIREDDNLQSNYLVEQVYSKNTGHGIDPKGPVQWILPMGGPVYVETVAKQFVRHFQQHKKYYIFKFCFEGAYCTYSGTLSVTHLAKCYLGNSTSYRCVCS